MPELAGKEEAFPEPDNQSKMKRSCENAEHVGKQRFSLQHINLVLPLFHSATYVYLRIVHTQRRSTLSR